MTHENKSKPIRVINASAPIRICDNGGWTDTWFAQYGSIFNIAVNPKCECQIEVYPRNYNEPQITLWAENFKESYSFDPQPVDDNIKFLKHPLLEAAISYMTIPKDISVKIHVYSEVPVGASTGTSAAVTVSLIGALERLHDKSITKKKASRYELAIMAQAIETKILKQQCGIQDQLTSVYGGVNYIEMTDYPESKVEQLMLLEKPRVEEKTFSSESQQTNNQCRCNEDYLLVDKSIWWELERRLILIYLGNSHVSSQVHEAVIKELEGSSPDCKKLNDLRLTAKLSRDAILNGDLEKLGQAMIRNTEAQIRLHPDLVSPSAMKCISIAKKYGAVGYKVNGAGGCEGGSLTILTNCNPATKRAIIVEIESEKGFNFKSIPVTINTTGLQVWESKP